MQLGLMIAKLRIEKGLSQRALAEALNVSTSVVGMWETNKRLPSIESFLLIIDYFGISADYILEKDRKLRPEQYINKTNDNISPEFKKILNTFYELNEDNKDIIIGEAKKLLKSQKNSEKKENYVPTAKAT